MAPVSSLFLMFLISLFNPYGAVSISIAIFLSPNSKPKTQNPKLLTFLVGYSIALSRFKQRAVAAAATMRRSGRTSSSGSG